jgi:hypothetical protein
MVVFKNEIFDLNINKNIFSITKISNRILEKKPIAISGVSFA